MEIRDQYYVLEGHNPRKAVNYEEWVDFFKDIQNRQVAHTLKNGVNISTVFLGIDHNFIGGTPLLFETMIFGGKYDGNQWRCSEWDEAIKQHNNAVELVERINNDS